MASRRIIYLVSLAAVFLFHLAYQLWFSWFAFMAILLLPVFSLLVSLPAMCTARLDLGKDCRITQGSPQQLTVRYESLYTMPPWRCRLTVERPLTGQRWSARMGDLLPTDHCGGLICTVRKARVYDYLGLVSLPIKNILPLRVLVRPRPVSMRDVELNASQPRSWIPKPGGGYAENHELRLYRPGDSVQQIHWKLSAKTGKLILREPMEPVRGRLLLRLDLMGDQDRLDRKLGQLLWLGGRLLEGELRFQIQALTGDGLECWTVTDQPTLMAAMDALLCRPCAQSGSVLDRQEQAQWQRYIGGGSDA